MYPKREPSAFFPEEHPWADKLVYFMQYAKKTDGDGFEFAINPSLVLLEGYKLLEMTDSEFRRLLHTYHVIPENVKRVAELRGVGVYDISISRVRDASLIEWEFEVAGSIVAVEDRFGNFFDENEYGDIINGVGSLAFINDVYKISLAEDPNKKGWFIEESTEANFCTAHLIADKGAQEEYHRALKENMPDNAMFLLCDLNIMLAIKEGQDRYDFIVSKELLKILDTFEDKPLDAQAKQDERKKILDSFTTINKRVESVFKTETIPPEALDEPKIIELLTQDKSTLVIDNASGETKHISPVLCKHLNEPFFTEMAQ